MYTKEHVAALVDQIKAHKIEPPVELTETHSFGLGLELFDPVSHQIITVARPHRADIGQSEILLSAPQVAQAVAGARMTRLHAVRTAGFASLEAAAEHDKRQAEAAALAAKQAEERAQLDAQHAEATAKAAEAEHAKAAKDEKDAETAEQKAAREQAEADRLASEAAQRQQQPQPQPRPAV